MNKSNLDRRKFLSAAGAAAAAFALPAQAAPPRIFGGLAPDYAAVNQAFADNFTQRGDVGASVAIYYRGQLVVDLWGGIANAATNAPWQQNTMAIWQSCTKGLTTTVVHLLAERGKINLYTPITHYWPEFGAAGKSGITVGQVLSHQSGLAVLDAPPYLFLNDVVAWTPLVNAMSVQAPVWAPGSAHGYHTQTFGFILDEVVRRATGKTVGQIFQEEISGPFNLSLWIGLPLEQEPNVAPLIAPAAPAMPITDPRLLAFYTAIADPSSLLYRSSFNPLIALSYDDLNSPPYHQAPLTSSNAIGTSRSVAKMYASLIGLGVGGRRLLNPLTVNMAAITRVSGPDAVVPGVNSAWGLGYAKNSDLNWFPNGNCFGHNGAGGAVAFADPVNQIAFAYQPNNLILDYNEPRAKALVSAFYGALGLPVSP